MHSKEWSTLLYIHSRDWTTLLYTYFQCILLFIATLVIFGYLTALMVKSHLNNIGIVTMHASY